MANVKINDLPAASGANLTDRIPATQSSTTRYLTPSQILALLTSSDIGTILGLPRTVGWYVEGSIAATTNQGPNYIIDQNCTITGVSLYAKVAPTGSAADFDIQVSTNNGSSFATLFSTRPTIAAGSKVGGGSAVLSTTTLSVGDILRLDIVATGGTPAQSVTALLKMKTR